MSTRISAAEGARLLGKPVPSKYRSQVTVYDGMRFHSKREAEYAAELDVLKRAGEIRGWARQIAIPLVVNGVRVAKIIVDFKIITREGRHEFHEVKGHTTKDWKLKWALFEALYPTLTKKVIK